MSMKWMPPVRQARRLGVYAAPASKSPVWNAVMGKVLGEFNALSKRHGLGVQLVASTQAPKDGGGADVAVNIATGNISLEFPGVDAETIQFDGNWLHGRTRLLSRNGIVFKAFVYLPATPKINTPSGQRLVGPKVLTLIAIHELFHACGLENRDHAPSGLFQASPDVDYGDTANADRTRVQRNLPRFMPPFVIDSATVKTLKELWTS